VEIGRHIRSFFGKRYRLIGIVAVTIAISFPGAVFATHATAALTAYSVCDHDGPCLNLIDATSGSAVTMYTYSSTDSYEALSLEPSSGDYGCSFVIPGCPFTNSSVATEFAGDTMYILEWTYWGGCADAYPAVDMEWGSCSLDRSVFIDDDGVLISPYWTNQSGTLYVLYGPPRGDQAYVTAYTGSTREFWNFEPNSA
jgi:hypothetical protein